MLGLLAPEIVAYTAWYQQRAAVRLTAKMKAILIDSPTSVTPRNAVTRFLACIDFRSSKSREKHVPKMHSAPDLRRHHPWTMTHSFYAIMGGFAFDMTEAEPQFLPNGRSRLTINPKGLIYLAETAPKLIPDLSKEFIRDKSNADGLAKLLVCLQALWFCMQCILRLAEGYAIALLELNVFGHALCALLIYALWWQKPLDIEEPTLMSGEETWELCALMCMSSSTERERSLYLWETYLRSRHGLYLVPAAGCELLNGSRFGDIWSKPWCLPDDDLSKRLHYSDIAFMFFEWSPHSKNLVGSNSSLLPQPNDTGEGNCYTKTNLLPGKIVEWQQAFGFRCTGPWRPSDLDFDKPLNLLSQMGTQYPGLRTSCWLDATDLRRFELCSKALQQYSPEIDRHDLYKSNYPFVSTLSDCVGNWPSLVTLAAISPGDGMKHAISAIGGIAVAIFIYGGLHLLAWNAPFASTAQKVLWRFSGTCVASSGIFGLAIMLTMRKSMLWGPDTLEGILNLYTLISFPFVVLVAVSALVLARTFLVVECFLQLAHLPQSAYQLPSWSQYFPHIG